MSGLDLKMPDQPPESQHRPTNTKGNALTVINTALLLVCMGLFFMNKPSQTKAEVSLNTEPNQPTADVYREDIVLKLKKAGAYAEAAKLIDVGLNQDGLSNERKALLLKQKGDLLAETKNKGQALQAYYTAELLVSGEEEKRELTQAIIHTLRAMGKYSAVSSEVARKNRERISGKKELEKDPVVAKIDGTPVYLSDFEIELQKHIDREIARLTFQVTEVSEVEKIKEQVKKQYSAPYEKLKYLQNYVSSDILYREALDWKLNEHPKYIEGLEDFKKNMLRSLVIEKNTLVENVDDLDLKNFIETNRAQLALSTDAGTLDPSQIEAVKPKALTLYKQEKQKEKMQLYQQDLMKRHQVEIFREPFTEGAK